MKPSINSFFKSSNRILSNRWINPKIVIPIKPIEHHNAGWDVIFVFLNHLTCSGN